MQYTAGSPRPDNFFELDGDNLMQAQRSSCSKLLSYCSGLLIVTGLGIGWLMGLSVSPVVSIVITSLTGSAAAIIATMSGVERKITDTDQSEKNEKIQTRRDVNPLPLALLIVGIIVGSGLGIFARSNDLLGSDISAEMQKWSEIGIPEQEIARRLFEIHVPLTSQLAFTPGQGAALKESDISAEIQKWSKFGILEEEIAHRLFEIHFPLNSQLASTPEQRGASTPEGVLFSISVEQCDTLRAASIRAEIEDSDALADALRRIKELERLPDIVSPR
jgi:multisubunit Na+/H+ antiporter MnhC subunit